MFNWYGRYGPARTRTVARTKLLTAARTRTNSRRCELQVRANVRENLCDWCLRARSVKTVPYGRTVRLAWFSRTGARTRTNSQGVGPWCVE